MRYSLCLFLGMALVTLVQTSSLLGADQPNVVLIYVDDMGWGDLGANGVASDVKTPHLDALAASGVRFTDGYVTAPQCAPSRAGLMTGKYQQKFGYEWNIHGPLPLEEATIAERIQSQGYTTGMVGKWHLLPESAHTEWIDENLNGDWSSVTEGDTAPYRSYNRGFDDAFEGQDVSVRTTFDLEGNTLSEPTQINYGDDVFRVDLQTQAGLTFIDRHVNKEDPFFLYLSYFSPHEPLEAPQEYLDRFPGEMPERRRYALAMNAAVDDGVGQVIDKLEQHGLRDNTLVMFMSDNGAPLDYVMPDGSIAEDSVDWNGSLNTPFVGQKAMLAEGGIRVPFVASWPGTLPAGTVYEEPVMQLDAAATAVAVAGGDISSLDGKNLVPYLRGEIDEAPHQRIYSRFGSQESVREGDWKLLRMTNGRVWLFDLSVPEPERVNLAGEYPVVVDALTHYLDNWVDDLPREQFSVPYAGEVVAFNHFLPKPVTEVVPEIYVDFGYDHATSTEEILVNTGNFESASFTGIRLGAGVQLDVREGASRPASNPGGGALSFVDWDLSSSISIQNLAIETEHYIEFELHVGGEEALAINGVQLIGTADTDTNLFRFYASSDGFADEWIAIANETFLPLFGNVDDPEYPVRNYQPLDFVPSDPLLVEEGGSTWAFRLYIQEEGKDDLNPLMISSIAFELEDILPGDITRDGTVDEEDLLLLTESYGEATSGEAFLGWLREYEQELPVTADFNQDGTVNAADLAVWYTAFATADEGDADGDLLTTGVDFLAWQRQFDKILSSDFNADGQVDGTDLAIWMEAFGESEAGDTSGDGATNGADFLAWQRQFSSSNTAQTSTTVPEPHSLVLMLLAVALGLSGLGRTPVIG